MENEKRRQEKYAQLTSDEQKELQKSEAAQKASVVSFDEKTGKDASINMKAKKRNDFFNALGNLQKKIFKNFPSKKQESGVEQDNAKVQLVGKPSLISRFVGIDKKKTYIGVGVFLTFVLVAFFGGSYWSSANYDKKMQQSKQEMTQGGGNDTAVTGNHLNNVPKDYKTLAEKEKEYRREREEKDNESYSDDSYAASRNRGSENYSSDSSYSSSSYSSSPSSNRYEESRYTPYIPSSPSVPEKKTDPADEAYAKALEEQLALKAKANSSPIKFELRKDE